MRPTCGSSWLSAARGIVQYSMVACHSCVSRLIEFVFAGENNHRKNAVEMGLTLKKHVVNCRAPAVLQTLSVQLSTTGVGSMAFAM